MSRIKALIAWVKALLAALRRRRPLVDHVFQAASRYSGGNGSRLVSTITLPGFLAFFPLVALALSIAGYVAHYDAHAQTQITKAISGYFPGLVGTGKGQIDVSSIADNRTSTGVVGLVGLLLSGLGLISTLRSALRSLWRLPRSAGNFFLARGRDVLTLVTLGVALLLSFALTAAGTSAATTIVRHSSLPDGGASEVLLRAAAIAIAVGGDVLLFGAAFRLLPQTRARLRDTLDGALFAAIGFEILKTFGSEYLTRTTHNPLYGVFATVIGLLVWTNLVAQLFVFAAAWAVTAPYTPDAPPSATALEPAGVPTLDLPAATAVVPHERLARGAGTAAFGALCGVAVVVGVRALRTVVPKSR